MSYALFTDTSANLSPALMMQHGIRAVPLSYTVDGAETVCPGCGTYDEKAFYNLLRDKNVKVQTSLAGVQRFTEAFEESLKEGQDILYVGLSSGISGTCQSAAAAADELSALYPDRKIRIVDSRAASLAEGIWVLEAARLKEDGTPLEEAESWLLTHRSEMRQHFTVADLHYLHRGGRVSGLTAVIGSVLHINPLLCGDEEGKIRTAGKVRGRRKAIEALAEEYSRNVEAASSQTVAISHGDCAEDAALLAELIAKSCNPAHILIEYFEPVTGSHVGPGALALFFRGKSLE